MNPPQRPLPQLIPPPPRGVQPQLPVISRINTLFGVSTKSYHMGQFTNTFSEEEFEDATNDYIFRQEGLSRDILNAENKITIRYNPKVYIEAKTKHFRKFVLVNTRKKFKEIFEFYMSQGYTQEESTNKAKQESNYEYNELLKKHEIKYPYSIETVLKKVK